MRLVSSELNYTLVVLLFMAFRLLWSFTAGQYLLLHFTVTCNIAQKFGNTIVEAENNL